MTIYERFETETKGLQASIDGYQQHLVRQEREAAAGDARASATADRTRLNSWSDERNRLEQQAKQTKRELEAARHRLGEVARQHEQFVEQIESLKQRKADLVIALAKAMGAEREQVQT